MLGRVRRGLLRPQLRCTGQADAQALRQGPPGPRQQGQEGTLYIYLCIFYLSTYIYLLIRRWLSIYLFMPTCRFLYSSIYS